MAAAPAPSGVEVLMELIENARETLRDGDFKAAYEALARIRRHAPEPAAIPEEAARRIAIAEDAARNADADAVRRVRAANEEADKMRETLAALRALLAQPDPPRVRPDPQTGRELCTTICYNCNLPTVDGGEFAFRWCGVESRRLRAYATDEEVRTALMALPFARARGLSVEVSRGGGMGDFLIRLNGGADWRWAGSAADFRRDFLPQIVLYGLSHGDPSRGPVRMAEYDQPTIISSDHINLAAE